MVCCSTSFVPALVAVWYATWKWAWHEATGARECDPPLVPLPPPLCLQVAPDVDLLQLARDLPGLVGARGVEGWSGEWLGEEWRVGRVEGVEWSGVGSGGWGVEGLLGSNLSGGDCRPCPFPQTNNQLPGTPALLPSLLASPYARIYSPSPLCTFVPGYDFTTQPHTPPPRPAPARRWAPTWPTS